MDALDTIYVKTFKSPYGELLIGVYDGKLCLCDWKYRRMRKAIDTRISKGLKGSFIEQDHELHTVVIEQLQAYFNKTLTRFDLPILFVGTPFQESVWKQLTEIPYGETLSYLKLAEKLDNKLAVRAVASANGANALSLVVPCHRIVGSNNDLVGYAGGIHVKKKLLQLESRQLTLFE